MLTIVSQELGKAHFNAIMFQTWEVEQGEVADGDCTLEWEERLLFGQLTRMGFGAVLLLEGLLH